jgi:6-phosphogluconolactonase/glucosamine-6-phosphate isomerase/deaminase
MINLKNKIFSSREDCFREFVKDISALLLGSVKKYGEASFAVSGGQTPQHVFPILAKKLLPWGQISITLVDERWVEPLHPDSNEGLARRLLMKGPAAAARFIGLKTSADNPFDGQENCEVALAGLCWPLDAIFLGMGEDGHIASLFPGEADWLYAPARTFPVASPLGSPSGSSSCYGLYARLKFKKAPIDLGTNTLQGARDNNLIASSGFTMSVQINTFLQSNSASRCLKLPTSTLAQL